MAKVLLSEQTENVVGNAVAFAAPTTLFLDGLLGDAFVVIEARVPSKAWHFLHRLDGNYPGPILVPIAGAYELRATVANASAVTNLDLNGTEPAA